MNFIDTNKGKKLRVIVAIVVGFFISLIAVLIHLIFLGKITGFTFKIWKAL